MFNIHIHIVIIRDNPLKCRNSSVAAAVVKSQVVNDRKPAKYLKSLTNTEKQGRSGATPFATHVHGCRRNMSKSLAVHDAFLF